jgi:precorrin-3B methylase
MQQRVITRVMLAIAALTAAAAVVGAPIKWA